VSASQVLTTQNIIFSSTGKNLPSGCACVSKPIEKYVVAKPTKNMAVFCFFCSNQEQYWYISRCKFQFNSRNVKFKHLARFGGFCKACCFRYHLAMTVFAQKPLRSNCFFLSCKTGCILGPTEKQP